jgi:hypothetical protein
MALEGFVSDGNELAIVESFGFKWLNRSINNRHNVPLRGLKKLTTG